MRERDSWLGEAPWVGRLRASKATLQVAPVQPGTQDLVSPSVGACSGVKSWTGNTESRNKDISSRPFTHELNKKGGTGRGGGGEGNFQKAANICSILFGETECQTK